MTRMTAPVAATRAPSPPSLLHRAHLPFAVGAVALVTLGAFENRAVLTVLPTVAERLGGLWLFGAAAAAPMISFVLATAVAGTWADRRGPLEPMYAGLGLFVLAQAAMGLAPSMAVFAAARLGGGLAEGLIDVGLVVLMARALPEELRAKVFAAFAAAWVLPSVLGPALAGAVAEHLGWRTVFLMAIVLVVPATAMLRPAMARSRATLSAPTRWTSDERRMVGAAALVALALVLLTAGGSMLTRDSAPALLGATASLVGLFVLLPSIRAVLPPGVLTLDRGIPTVIALRGMVAAAFGLVGAFIPLMLTTVHGFTPTTAGVSLTVTGLFWSLGSQLHGLHWVQRRVPPAQRLRIGFGLIASGVAGPGLLSLDLLPAWAGLSLWAVAGIGMGVSSPTLSTHLLSLSPSASQGRYTAASNLAGSVSQSLVLGAAGALIAWQSPELPGWVFALVMAAGGVIAFGGAAVAGRAVR
jgi:MFS family permease